ncbi:MAG: hypothetical protein CMJ89_08815, partial [Planctomycetes bacterium]|nr:hypothetical protein [Planctomycetota bacterium]
MLDITACSAGSARGNTPTPLNLGVDYVPLTGDDSMGFYAIYSVKATQEGLDAENNTNIDLFPLSDGNVLMFGAGYGDPYGPGTALYDAAHDMSRVDQVIRTCMGRSPASSQIIFVTPHGHGDHINPAAFRELRALGYTIAEIWYHQADEALLYALGGWSPKDLAARRPITGGDPCGSEVLSFPSPVGKIWFFLRPGHTLGSLDLVVDLENDSNNRFIVRGSGTDGSCPTLDGTRETVNPHGNVMLRAVTPQIMNLSPQRGTPLGGTEVTILGKNFLAEGAALPQVLFGGFTASAVQIVDDSTLTAHAPPSSGPRVVDVTMVNRNGFSEIEGGYTYNAEPVVSAISPSSGSPSGGFRVVVNGSGFLMNEAGETDVLFGNVSSTQVRVKSDTQIVCRAPLGAPGSTVAVTVTNQNGRSNAGFITFGGLVSVSSLTPPSGPSAGGSEVTFHGKGLLSGGPLHIKFGAAVPTSLLVINDTTAVCIAPPGNPGQTVNVTVGNRNGDSILLNGYRYNQYPLLTSISPSSGPSSGGSLMTIKGIRFRDLGSGPAQVLFGSQPALDVLVLSEDTIMCTAPPGPGGLVDITLQNANGSDVLLNAFTFETALRLNTVTPANASGLGGTQLTLSGLGFLDDPGGVNVSVGSRPASAVNVIDDTTLTCILPVGQPGNSVDVVVGNSRGNAVSLANGFHYYDAPTLAHVSPTNGPASGGTLVLLSGKGYQDNSPGTNSVMFGILPSPSVVVLGDDSLLCEAPSGQPGALVPIGVTNNNGMVTLANAFTYDAPAPNLTFIVPEQGPSNGGTDVTLTGSGFQGVNAGATFVRFGAMEASNVQVIDDSTIQCNAPAGAPGALEDVTIVNNNGSAVLAGAFRYLDDLTLSGLSPTHASPVGGTLMTLTGSGFTSSTAGVTSVRVGDTLSSTVNILSNTSLSFTLPPGTPDASVDVVVSNDNATASLTEAIRYHAAPSIASLSPTSGSELGATSVLILGSGFLEDAAGVPAVEFGSVAAAATSVLSDTSILCLTPPGNANATVEVTVTNTNGTALLSGAFTYNPRVPTLSSITPVEGPSAGGTVITLNGSEFTAINAGATVVLIGATPATAVQVDSDSRIFCTTPDGLPGLVDVTVLNNNGTSTLADAFRYLDGLSTNTIMPQNASSLGGALITIGGD